MSHDPLAALAAGKPVTLAAIDTRATHGQTKDGAAAQLAADRDAIGELADRMRAEGRQALLVVFQGMDTSGKDGAIASTFRHVNPLSVSVAAFKAPSAAEKARDFLWRVHAAVPAYGHVVAFNRSHYEGVLVERVRDLAPGVRWRDRFRQINAFERLLTETGTTVLKIMLHISKEEQRQRLQERIDVPRKRWKFNDADLEERAHWDDYMVAYEAALPATSTRLAPWYVVPADRNWYRDCVVARITRTTMERMDPKYPPGDPTISGLAVE